MTGTIEDDEDPSLRWRAAVWALLVVLGAIFPRWMHFPGRLRGRALAKYVAGHFLVTFSGMQWLKPWGERQNALREAVRAELTAELGRDPTFDELYERRTGRALAASAGQSPRSKASGQSSRHNPSLSRSLRGTDPAWPVAIDEKRRTWIRGVSTL